jgi:sec-independent protein translocase protein TatB
MFDVGFSELIVIGIVALVVIGPERLPKVARTAGHLLGRLQRYVNDVKADINREMQLDELRKLQADMQESARDLGRNLNTEIQSIKSTVEGAESSAPPISEPATKGLSAALTEEPAQPSVPAESAQPLDAAVVSSNATKG